MKNARYKDEFTLQDSGMINMRQRLNIQEKNNRSISCDLHELGILQEIAKENIGDIIRATRTINQLIK